MKKIIVVLMGLVLVAFNVDAICDPANQICDVNCGTPFTAYSDLDPANWTIYNWSQYGPSLGYSCNWESWGTPVSNGLVWEVYDAEACRAYTFTPWENYTSNCAGLWNNTGTTQEENIVCPDYAFMGRAVLPVDCIDADLIAYVIGGETGLSHFNFSDSFFAGATTTTTTTTTSTTTTTVPDTGGSGGYAAAHLITGAGAGTPAVVGTPVGPAPLAIAGGGGGALPAITDVLFTVPSPRGMFEVTLGKAIVLAAIVGLPSLLLAFKAFTFKLR